MSDEPWRELLKRNVAALQARVQAACDRAGRARSDVRVVAVTKYVTGEVVAALPGLGLPDLGENRVSQLVDRATAGGPTQVGWPLGPVQDEPAAPRWHMIGHVQRNKVKTLLPHARILHSLDSERLARAVEQHAAQLGTEVDCFVEVNLAGEDRKEGLSPDAVEPLLVAIRAGCPHLRVRGLMTMAPWNPDAEAARPYFVALRELLQGLQARGVVSAGCRHLSMGMSQDYAVAVEEGATWVRVGSALYTGLPTSDPRVR